MDDQTLKAGLDAIAAAFDAAAVAAPLDANNTSNRVNATASAKAYTAVSAELKNLSKKIPTPGPTGPPPAPQIVSVTKVTNGWAVKVRPVPASTTVQPTEGFDVLRYGVKVGWPNTYDVPGQQAGLPKYPAVVPIVDNKDGTFTYTDTGSGNNTTGPGLDTGAGVSYNVDAYNSKGTSALSATVSVAPTTPPVVTPPPPPPPNTSLYPGLTGLFAYDHQYTTAEMLANTVLFFPKPTVDKPRLIIAHLDISKDWPLIENVWFQSIWGQTGPEYQLVVTVGPWPAQVGGSLAAAARGDYAAHWENICRNLANAFPGRKLWVRFAHEPNCCYQWHADVNPAAYKAMWPIFAPIFRKYHPNGQLIFCPIFGLGKVGIDQILPDRAFFDRIGMDYYPQASWSDDLTESFGLKYMGELSRALGVPGGLYECNPAQYPQSPSVNCPDDPNVMLRVWNFVNTYHFDYCSYCDGNAEVDSFPTKFPKNLDVITRTWGTLTPHIDPVSV